MIAGSLRVFLGELPSRLDELPRDRRNRTICRSGQRAALAASLLDRARIPAGLIAREGVPALLATCEGREGRRI